MTVSTTAEPSSRYLADPGHGTAFTDHLVTAHWSADTGWQDLALGPLRELSLHPGTSALHYGQAVFEGLKAFVQQDGGVAVFRPRDNAARFARSAARLAMPVLPDELFMTALDLLVRADAPWLTDNPRHALYLRPLMFASEVNLLMREATEFTFVLMAFVAAGYFGDGAGPVTVMIARDHARALPGGTGDVKCAANYAPTLLTQRRAREAGCRQVVWLDPDERRWVEELGAMNLFFVVDGALVTPRLTGNFLPGITRDTLLALAARAGYEVREQPVSVDDWREGCRSGAITESFACGTAATVTPIGRVRDGDGDFTVGTGLEGPVTAALRTALLDAQHGRLPDVSDWLHRVD
ncbi:branched-chain amino acid aminotransferase [Streptomyces sp. SID10815]|uniref:branched-chain amino acid aminotransferase n=1 Tax=Streptomyces sp. SID10815 TaxID=2706027 RepID=UPI0013C9093E|nr:branched-chain amino acid aminotransferase [Streptomyces sp. SID10815]NEA46422.1 branched-chain amino acid aminotransferase [Streptomyces sp. SID10815]